MKKILLLAAMMVAMISCQKNEETTQPTTSLRTSLNAEAQSTDITTSTQIYIHELDRYFSSGARTQLVAGTYTISVGIIGQGYARNTLVKKITGTGIVCLNPSKNIITVAEGALANVELEGVYPGRPTGSIFIWGVKPL